MYFCGTPLEKDEKERKNVTGEVKLSKAPGQTPRTT